MILLADSEGPDQAVRMRRLIWALAVRICQKTRFRRARSKEFLLHMRTANVPPRITCRSMSADPFIPTLGTTTKVVIMII